MRLPSPDRRIDRDEQTCLAANQQRTHLPCHPYNTHSHLQNSTHLLSCAKMNTISTVRLRVDELENPQTALEIQGAALNHGSALVWIHWGYTESWVSTRARVDPLGLHWVMGQHSCTCGSTGVTLSHGSALVHMCIHWGYTESWVSTRARVHPLGLHWVMGQHSLVHVCIHWGYTES